ncbi:hypothetical protein [Bifidobacterium pseudocatenulatum]|nr:hypothetical protein [Bifidobacterium pseudocatenulatum]
MSISLALFCSPSMFLQRAQWLVSVTVSLGNGMYPGMAILISS